MRSPKTCSNSFEALREALQLSKPKTPHSYCGGKNAAPATWSNRANGQTRSPANEQAQDASQLSRRQECSTSDKVEPGHRPSAEPCKCSRARNLTIARTIGIRYRQTVDIFQRPAPIADGRFLKKTQRGGQTTDRQDPNQQPSQF